ncbi:hypothetical protein EDB89DRAFT_1908350 [Lactarius sanguifluus]|nr:hypothetical protein EDB89DRAFT_1908350 [Lactarius sanguifluus]
MSTSYTHEYEYSSEISEEPLVLDSYSSLRVLVLTSTRWNFPTETRTRAASTRFRHCTLQKPTKPAAAVSLHCRGLSSVVVGTARGRVGVVGSVGCVGATWWGVCCRRNLNRHRPGASDTQTCGGDALYDTTTTTERHPSATTNGGFQHPSTTTMGRFQSTTTTGDHNDERCPSTAMTGRHGNRATMADNNSSKTTPTMTTAITTTTRHDNGTLTTVHTTTWTGSPAASY